MGEKRGSIEKAIGVVALSGMALLSNMEKSLPPEIKPPGLEKKEPQNTKKEYLSKLQKVAAADMHKVYFADQGHFVVKYFEKIINTEAQERAKILAEVKLAAQDSGIPEQIILGVVAKESHGHPHEVSKTGDRGLCGINLKTLKELDKMGLKLRPDELFDARKNLKAFTLLYSAYYQRFPNHYFAQIAWNRGPTALEKIFGELYPQLSKRKSGALDNAGKARLQTMIARGEIDPADLFQAKEKEFGGYAQLPTFYKYPLVAGELAKMIELILSDNKLAYQSPNIKLAKK